MNSRQFFVTLTLITMILFLINERYFLVRPVDDNGFLRKHRYDDVDVFVYVLTGRYHFKERKLQRDSGLFKNLPKNVIYKYIIGYKSCPVPWEKRVTPYSCHGGGPTEEFDNVNKRLDKQLLKEMNEFGDIVVVDMIDYYRSLPKKVKLALKWGLENTSAKWFQKIDDDCYFNSVEILNGIRDFDETKSIIMGSISKNVDVPHDGKWAEMNYKKSRYPPFPIGSKGHLSSRKFATDVVSRSDELFEYQGEDVSIGIWVHEFFPYTELVDRSDFMNLKPACGKQSWVCGHDLTRKDFEKLIYNHNS